MSIRIFGPIRYKNHLLKSGIFDTLSAPTITAVPNGLICTTQKRTHVGVYDRHNKYVPQSSLYLTNKQKHISHLAPRPNTPYIDCDVVFLGDIHWHFGHFLLEHTNRLWAACTPPAPNVKYVFVYSNVTKTVPEYIYDFTNLLGISRQDIIILTQDTRFKTVYVPQSACNKYGASSKWHETFEFMASHTKSDKRYEKVYLSRTMLASRRIFGEKHIEEIFKQNGYHIVYPETISLSEQISIVKNAKILAGCYGTALHLALFMQSGGRVIAIKRNTEIADNFTSQHLINQACGLNGDFIWGSIETQKTQHFTDAPQIIGCTEYMREFFESEHFKHIDNCTEFYDTEINEYLEQSRLYNKRYGGKFINQVKRILIKISACFIPVRTWRGRYRTYMRTRFIG